MESFFSGNESKSFLHVSSDNRIHLWDTDTSKERRSYVEKNNLAHSYTCSSWKTGKKDNLGYFAVGASDGTIIVWDLTRGVVSKVFGQVNESPVPSSIAFSNDNKAIFVTSSSNSSVVQYDLSNGEQSNAFKVGKRGVNKIIMNPKVDHVFAAGSSSIKLVDMSSGRKRKLASKFPGGVMAMCFTPCGVYLAVAGTGSREVLLFDVRETGSDGTLETTPLAVIAVMGEPKSLSARTVRHRQPGGHGSGSSCVEVLCLYEDVDACFIRVPLLTPSSSSSSSSSSANSSSRHGEPMICNFEVGHLVLAACFGTPGSSSSSSSSTGTSSNSIDSNSDSSGVVTVAVGLKSSPSFHTVQVVEDGGINGLGHGQVLERVVISSSSIQPSKKKKRDQQPAADEDEEEEEGHGAIAIASKILGPNDMGGVKRPKSSSHPGVGGAGAGGGSGGDSTAMELGGLTSLSGNVTLEDRWAALSVSLQEMEASGKEGNNHAAAGSGSAGNGGKTGASGIKPSSSALLALIDQALQSGDDSLLDQGLACDDISVIQAIVRKIAPARIVMLIRKLVTRYEKQPYRSLALTRWLSAMFRTHASFLMNVPNLTAQFGGLGQLLEKRLGSYSRLASLAGRLDLLLSQIGDDTSGEDGDGDGEDEDAAVSGGRDEVHMDTSTARFDTHPHADSDGDGDEHGDDDGDDDSSRNGKKKMKKSKSKSSKKRS